MAMLCCVSRKAAGGSSDVDTARCRASAELTRFVEVCRDLGKVRDEEDEALRKLDEAVLGVAAVANSFSTFRRLETLPEESFFDAYRHDSHQPEASGEEGALHQCTVCDRKFAIQSYERHIKICERTAARKRKPFDSAKQRIKGTELAEFVQHKKSPETIHEHPTRRTISHEDKQAISNRRQSGNWKEKSDELRRSIKAVKDKTVQQTTTTTTTTTTAAAPAQSSPSSSSSSTQNTQQHHHHRPSTLSLVTSSGAPQRSNEKGTCPTCQRQFGVKSYDRHVAFCRERATRLPSSPQTNTNVAKERLEARMKYRAPGLKNRKPTNKEKYSPGGVAQQQQQQQSKLQSPLMARNKNIDSPKLPQLKRPGQTKESGISTSGPLKSRPMDRSNRNSDSQESLNPAPMKQLFASRRLLLLSEVLPSKVLLSKTSLSSSSSQKSSARLVTNFLQKEFTEDSPYTPKVESLKQKLKKKLKFRIKNKKVKEAEEEKDSCMENIEMMEITEQKRDYLTWRQIREEIRNNPNDDMDTIDKIEEPILSHRTGLSTTNSHDDGNSTMDEFEMNEKMVRYHETEERFVIDDKVDDDGNAIEKNEDNERNDEKAINPTLNRTYVVDDTTRLVSLSEENDGRADIVDENKEAKSVDNQSDDDGDDLSVASTKTFNKSNCESVNVDELKNHQQDIMPEIITPRIHAQNECKREDSESYADGNDELTILTNKIKEKLLNRPKKYLSLPNIDEMKQEKTPRVPRLKINEYNKEQDNDPTPSNNELRLPQINCPTRRCATYVVDKPSGDNGLKNKNLEQRDSKLLYDYYRNASFSDLSSVRTEDLQVTDYDFEDFTDENESNASELLKEIDACLMKSNFLDSQDSLVVEFSKQSRPRVDCKTRRCRNARTNKSFDERDEETSNSNDLRIEKPKSQFDKEICTITRLDTVSHRDISFLPPIVGNRATEYRREKKFVKSKALRDIAERDTPRDDDDDNEKFQRFSKSRTRSRMGRRSHLLRSYERLPRCDLNSYIRRHPNFSLLLKRRIGNNYDPFYLLAEQQMNDLFSDTSDQSSTDGSSIYPPQKTNSSPNFPLSHSSAFAKFPSNSIGTNVVNNPSQNQSQSLPTATTDNKQQRASVIAPPTGFDDLTSSDISSDCTETNSLSRELLTSSSNSNSLTGSRITMNGEHVLGRRIIIDQNQALGGGEFAPSNDTSKINKTTNGVVHTNSNGINSKFSKANRSNSMRAVSAPKPPERKISSSSSSSDFARNNNKLKNNDMARSVNNFKNHINASNVSLNSIISSSDMEMKRSASLFDELLSSFEDDANSTSALPSLMSLIRNDPLLSSVPQQQNGHHQRNNGRINCSDEDAELSSPESVKRQECGKLSADSAYSSLNRKYSNNHGRSNNDVSNNATMRDKYKMSKFCHECGFKFPDSAKFCCECGVRRLTL